MRENRRPSRRTARSNELSGIRCRDVDEEMPALFGMTALRFSLVKNSCARMSWQRRRVQCAVPAQRQSAAGAGLARNQSIDADRLRDCSTSPPIDRRTARRGRRAAVDEQFLALHMGGIVRGQEQHRFRNVIGFAEAAERRR